MKAMFTKLGMSLLKYLLSNKAIHDQLRSLARKTDNTFDDAAMEKIIEYFSDVSKLIDKG